MKENRSRIQKGMKKFLAVALAITMLIPSVLNGTMTYTAYAADGDAGSTGKHTVTIQTEEPFAVGKDQMFDVFNNHDGTLTLGQCPEIALYPKWVHQQHEWNYIQEADGSIKAYCSNPDSKCEYYAENQESATYYAELRLDVERSEGNTQIPYSGIPVKAVKKTNTISGTTISEIAYKKYNAEVKQYEPI